MFQPEQVRGGGRQERDRSTVEDWTDLLSEHFRITHASRAIPVIREMPVFPELRPLWATQ